MLKRLWAIVVAGMLGATPAMAGPSIGLELLIDDSGSISASNFALQKNAYINSLTSLLPTDGSVALGVIEFDGNQHSIFSLQTITVATKANLLTALGAMFQFGGSTATGPTIQSAAAALNAFAGLSRRLIDVSTDGFGNVGINEGTAATNAVNNSHIDQVNVLCIGASANCTFNRGVGSFNLPATFQNFGTTLNTKLARELSVPEPSSIALFSFGLIGFFTMFRRRRGSVT